MNGNIKNTFFLTLVLVSLFTSNAIASELKIAGPILGPYGIAFMSIKIPSEGISFMMGSPETERNRYGNEIGHEVTLRDSFDIGITEVTQAQWKALVGLFSTEIKESFNRYSEFVGDDKPIVFVNWDEVQQFIKELNALNDGYVYRLLTETEWEFAARGGTTTPYFWGSDASELKRYTWHRENSDHQTHEVATKFPNPFGLHDMYGNVSELVEDLYSDDYAPQQAYSLGRVIRGGSWLHRAYDLRSAVRCEWYPDARRNYVGFRVARTPKE